MADFQGTATIPREYARAFTFQRAQVEKEFFYNFLEKSSSYKEHFRPTWDELIDNYMVIPQREAYDRIRFSPDLVKFPMRARDRSRLKDPETHQAVETIVAQAMGLLMLSREYISVSPRGSDDYERKRVLSRLLQSTLEMPGWFRTQYQAIKNAFIFGTSIIELTWLTRSRKQMTKQPIFDEVGNYLGEGVMPDDVIYRDGPLFQEIDIYDFYPDPGGTRIQENMDFCAKRGRMTKQKALELVEAGVYDKEPTLRAIMAAEGGTKGRKDGMFQKFPNIPTDTVNEYGMMTFFEGIGEVPYKPQDGARNRVLTMLNGEVVRSHINPMLDGNKWFKEIIVNPMSGRFYGMAPTEAVRYLQDSIDALLMAFTDTATLTAYGPLLYGSTWGGNPAQLKRRTPLDVIKCADVKQVAPLPVDTSALQFGMAELGRRKMSVREATGANNPLQGISGGGRDTATEVSELVRLASQRVDLMVQLIERDDYPWIGRTLLSRFQQFAPPGGIEAVFRGERVSVKLEDITEADVYFSGSRHSMSAYQQGAQFREAINMLSTNPMFVVQYPDITLIYLRDVLHIPNAENVIERAVKQASGQNMLEMALQGEGSGQSSPMGGGAQPFGTAAGDTMREGGRIA